MCQPPPDEKQPTERITDGPRVFARYVAVGDSSTEGLDDPDGRGGYHGWANRLAVHVAAAQDVPLLYANLAVRGRSTREIRDEQLAPAAAMRPDLVTLFSGTNDVVKRHFDADAVGNDVEVMQRTLIDAGATVLGFTLPDCRARAGPERRASTRVSLDWRHPRRSRHTRRRFRSADLGA
jgi:hypothetical protein